MSPRRPARSKRAASRSLELEPVARPRAIGPQRAVLRLGNAVEHHPLDPDVVVEVLEVPQPRDGAERVRRDRRRAVGRDVESSARSRGRDALRRPVIPPQRVTSAWRQSTAADAGSGSRPGRTRTRRPLSSSPAGPRSRIRRSPSRSSEQTGSSNHVTPQLVGVALRPGERLLAGERAVRVDVQLDVVADRLAGGVEPRRVALGLAPDLHLHARDARPRPSRRAARASRSSA